ncbi:Uncharacterized protein APZ42_014864 [Daphnia magna]|uniref:Uncharacterized protein n=1 Tax=Daphnia magna TaxID=35525 RepID=A0A162NYD4_9CRUS|nr:Uncharacterized protein APZ42_014864 [Daphnia magna]
MMNQVSWLSRRDLFSFSLFFWCHFFQLLAIPFVRSFIADDHPTAIYILLLYYRSFVRSSKQNLVSSAWPPLCFPWQAHFNLAHSFNQMKRTIGQSKTLAAWGCVFHFDFVYILGLILHVIHTVYIISFVDLFNPPEKGFFFMSILFFSIPPCCVFLFVFFSFFFEEEKMKKTPMSFFSKIILKTLYYV